MNDSKLLSADKDRRKAILLLAAAAVMWSLGGLLIKMVNANPLAISGARSAIAAIVLWIALKKPKITWSPAQIGAALFYAFMVLLFVAANKLTTAANAILLQFTSPIYVAILGAWILKEKVKLIDGVTIAVMLGGMALFFFDNLSAQGIVGNILAAASGVSFAGFTICMRLQKNGSALESVWMGNIATAVIGLPFLLQTPPDAVSWLNLGILGIVQLGIPYILYAAAIRHVSAIEAVLVSAVEPIFNPVWVLLMLGEIPGPLASVGGVVVLAAVTCRCIWSARREARAN